MAYRISIPPLAENNLVRNNCFGQGFSFYRHEGQGAACVMQGPPCFCRITGGTLHHAFDIDNQSHAAPESVFAYKGSYVLKFRARGKGKLKAGVRWRLSYFRGDMDFLEHTAPTYDLEEEFKEFCFEGTVDSIYASVNDDIFFEVLEGFADITGISLFYPEPAHDILFDRPHIAAAAGEEINFKCSGADELLCCYGHSENELTPELIKNTGIFKLQLPGIGGEGFRFVGINSKQNSRKSLFVSTPPPSILKKMRKCSFDASPRHLFFFGDSLTAYDAGRNYTDIAGAFLPDSWSYTNAGVGGDDLLRLARRLQGKPRTYRLEAFNNIWEKTPDDIFLFYGANDTKAAWKDDYNIPSTTPEAEKILLQEIIAEFRSRAPQAGITIISCSPGFYPYQLEHNRRLREIGVQHMLFDIPEHVKRFNRIAKEFARNNDCRYLDFYRVCNSYHDPKSLFIPDDGVHMSITGHQLLAATLLEYLQK